MYLKSQPTYYDVSDYWRTADKVVQAVTKIILNNTHTQTAYYYSYCYLKLFDSFGDIWRSWHVLGDFSSTRKNMNKWI